MTLPVDTIEDYLREVLGEISERGKGLTHWETAIVARLIVEQPNTFTPNETERIQEIYMEKVS